QRDALGDLVVGQLVLQVGQQLLGGDGGPGAHHDERVADLAPVRVRLAHHRGLHDVVVLRQHAVHLGRVDVQATGDDHVLGPAGDVDVTLVVVLRQVAGVQPPAGQCRLRGVRPVVVADHVRRGPADDLADLAGRDVVALAVHDPDLRRAARPPGGADL